MLKRIICLCLCVALLICVPACSADKRKFEKTAKEYFATFDSEQNIKKVKTDITYGKKGSVAIERPDTGVSELDLEILQYCKDLETAFYKNAATDADTLIISHKSYAPVKDLVSVQMHCKMTVSGNTTETTQSFCSGIEMTDGLKLLITIEARDGQNDINPDSLVSHLVTNDGIVATYVTSGGAIEKIVPFTKLRAFLPASLLETLPQTGDRAIDPSKKMVALTFDDGPHNTYSNKILDTLEKYNSVATFFEVGNLAEQGADTIKRAQTIGCEIASHTWSHGNLQTLPESSIIEQIAKADSALEAITGEKPKLLRPPYGAVGKTLKNTTDKYLIGWSVDTNDWKYRDKDKIVSTVKAAGDLDGDVVLMHSLYDSTAQAVDELVPYLIENGYQLVTVSELVKYKYQDTLQEGKYYAYNYFDYDSGNE